MECVCLQLSQMIPLVPEWTFLVRFSPTVDEMLTNNGYLYDLNFISLTGETQNTSVHLFLPDHQRCPLYLGGGQYFSAFNSFLFFQNTNYMCCVFPHLPFKMTYSILSILFLIVVLVVFIPSVFLCNVFCLSNISISLFLS